MKSSQWLGWAAVIAFIIGIQFAQGQNLAKGEAPAFSGQTLDGKAFDLAQLRGKPAVIYFWAEWCPICRAMQSTVQNLSRDVPLISVAMQSGNPAEVAKYMKEQGFNVPTLPDEQGEIAARYGLSGVPAVFVLGPESKIGYATMGYTTELGIRFRLWLVGLLGD